MSSTQLNAKSLNEYMHSSLTVVYIYTKFEGYVAIRNELLTRSSVINRLASD